MKNNTLHITIKCIAMLLLLVIVVPSVVKFTHIFEDHKHEVCETPSDSHYHEIEIDCEFYKFKLNTVHTFKSNSIELIVPEFNHKITRSQYHFVSDFQRLPFSLRGPPHLV